MADTAPNGMSIIDGHIAKNEYANLYLLMGNEQYLIKQYKEKLQKSLTDLYGEFNVIAFKGEATKVKDIAEAAMSLPFLSEKKVVIIEDSGYFKNGNPEMETVLSDMPDSTIIVFSESNIDRKFRLFKMVSKEGTLCLFDTPSERTLVLWLRNLFKQDMIQISDQTIYSIISSVGTDMNVLYNEVEKLRSYCFDKKVVSEDDVKLLCTSQVESKIFDMMEALSRRDKKTTMKTYDDLLQLREPPMRLLALISRQYDLLLKTKLALEKDSNNARIASIIKIPPFAVKKYISQCANYTFKELLNRTSKCQQADLDIKTGKMKDSLSVEMLIIDLLQ